MKLRMLIALALTVALAGYAGISRLYAAQLAAGKGSPSIMISREPEPGDDRRGHGGRGGPGRG